MRLISTNDSIVKQIDETLKTLLGINHETHRPYPAKEQEEAPLTPAEKKHAAGLMRVNYAGEVAAQALYQGQALTARDEGVKNQMQQAAFEEKEHLAWCKYRLDELDESISTLNAVWYLGSLFIGIAAGLAGDKWSLGFVAETEKQVVVHLEKHLGELPKEDRRSREIVKQMKLDESHHADMAHANGAAELPAFIRELMTYTSKFMTKTAYYL